MGEGRNHASAVDVTTDCGSCADRVVAELEREPGVASVVPGATPSELLVTYDPSRSTPETIERTSQRVHADLDDRFGHQELKVGGMDCADCARTIERAVGRIGGVSHADVSFTGAWVRYEYETGRVETERVADRIRSLGYEVARPGEKLPPTDSAWWRRRESRTLISAVLLVLALPIDLLDGPSWSSTALLLAAIVTGGVAIARSGLVVLRATRRPDINLLMAVAVVGAVTIGALVEAALVVVLFSVGELLEGRAVARARRELASLVSLAPDVARVRRTLPNGRTEERVRLVSELAVGDLVVVRPGERMPVDGRVVEGASSIDQAAITGESTPVDRGVGESVFAGTLNGQGMLVVELDADPGDSTLEKIGRLVVEAQARRSPSERWVDRFAAVYTPIVITAAVVVAVGFPLLGADWGDSFYNALALLILACPCALVISTPVSIVSSLARASAAGVLVKGGAHLERAATITVVAFDKTGTLTSGRPRVVSTEALQGPAEELLRLAASLEQGSEHPLARAIVAAAAERDLALEAIEGFEALTGLGARAVVGGRELRVGSPRLFDGLEARDAQVAAALKRVRGQGGTAVLVVADGTPLGVLGLADEPRPEADEAITDLARLGITRTVLLTGDNEAAGQAIGDRLGVTEVRAELMPQDKSAAITGLGPGVAMVGDGVNDAPALAAADLAIAMGTAGSDAAIEVADVALMGDDPRKVAQLIGTARWTRSVVRQNLAFALITKLGAVVLLALGALPLWAAVVSDVGASLIVVANGLRLMRGRPLGRLRRMPMLPTAAATPRADGPAVAPAAAAPDARCAPGAAEHGGGATTDACCTPALLPAGPAEKPKDDPCCGPQGCSS